MKLSNITKVYHNRENDVTAINDLCLEINQIGITAIVGSSGCGKTTLLHIMSGQDADFIGERTVKGHIEVIEQEIMLFEAMSVIDNLKMISRDNDKIEYFLKHFQMMEHQSKKVKQLSVGQKKRVQVIRSLLNNPDYLLCDEPTAALDHENAELVMEMLKEIGKKISVIIVTHDLALVDQYADVIVKMGKGSIESIEICKKNESLISQECVQVKKTLSQHLRLFRKMNVSRMAESLLMFVFIFVLCLSLFCSSLFSSLGHSVNVKEKWRTGENIITSKPNTGNDVYKPIDENDRIDPEASNIYFYYDLYNYDDIQLVKDNIPEVIGYRCGWNYDIYSQFGSWYFPMSYSSAEDYLNQVEIDVKKSGRDYTYQEINIKRDLDALSKEDKKKLANDFYTINFENLEKINYHSEVYFVENEKISINGSNQMNISIYQVFSHSQIPLKYGKWMQYDNEMIISENVANRLIQENNLSSAEELLGKEIPLSLFYRKSISEQSAPSTEVARFKVSGITHYKNEDENQVFLREGVWDQLRSDFYGFKDDVNYQFADFIVDENKNSEKIAKKVDELLESKESHFVTKAGSEIVKESYQNSSVFYTFTICMCLGMVALLVISHVIIRKREIKEQLLLIRYGYNSYQMMTMKMVELFTVVGIIQIIFLPSICEQLNAFASSLGYAYMINNDIIQYVIAWLISFVIVFVIETFFQRQWRK